MSQVVRLVLPICLAAVAACAQDAFDPAGGRGPVVVGEEAILDVASPLIEAPTGEPQLVWSQELGVAGASYICPHFARFDLPAKTYLKVSSPDGRQSHIYRGRGKMFEGVDSDGFWTAHILGESATIELYAADTVVAPGAVAIDRFAHGFQQSDGEVSIEAICTSDDSEWAQCYESSEPAVYDKSRAVVRLLINGSSACTGWLVGSEGHLITNEHCIGSASAAANTNFEFMAEGSCSTDCSSWGACPGVVEADTSNLLAVDASRDYALVQLPSNPSTTYGYFQLRNSGAVVGERIYIPQHPAHWGKKIALEAEGADAVVGSITEPACTSGASYNDVGYMADTQGGSSGSPVVSYGDHLVVALHHCANCPNRGVPIQQVIADAGNLLPPSAFPGGGDQTPPTVSITAPSDGATVSDTVTVAAVASDNVGVTEVRFYVDGSFVSTDDTAPYEWSWDTTTALDGSRQLEARAYDAASNSATDAISVVVNNGGGNFAGFDANLGAPACHAVGASCDSGDLLDGRANLGPEANQPNTIASSCADGTSGTYHSDESLDSIRVSAVGELTAGQEATVEVTVWAYSSYSSDYLDLYYAADANSPSWQLIGTYQPSGSGEQVITATYTLPDGALQAVRGNFRYNGSASACTTGGYDDRDDLVFAVAGGVADTTPPTATFDSPTDGATVSGTVALSASASDNVGVSEVRFYAGSTLIGTDTSSPYSLSWDSTTVADGSQGLSVVAEDAAGNTGNDSITITVANSSGAWDVEQSATDTPISIPDNNSTGIVSSMSVAASGTVAELEVQVDITHTYIGDLILTLECAGGTSVTLHDRSGGGADNIHQTYAVSACDGSTAGGTWRLRVSDRAGADVGTLDNWTLLMNVDSGTGPGPQTATHDAGLGAPACAAVGSSCGSDVLLAGRGTISGGAEANAPNTLDSCADGNSGTYQADESIEAIRVISTGNELVAGGTVNVEVDLWVWRAASDHLDLYHANDANNPSWTFVGTLEPSGDDAQTVSTSFTLGSGSLQAMRANFRYGGSASACTTGSYNDHDDLVFAVTP